MLNEEETMTHSRVTPHGQAMGANAAKLAELGKARLVEMGLDGIKGGSLRGEMCKSCACQRGSIPNGCLQTQLDFLKAAHEGKPFLCHSPQDGSLCAGWVRARAELVENPLPPEAVALLDKWEYSPPDTEGTP
jgi:hypothetical protein